MRARISRTASASPVRTARATMLWPQLVNGAGHEVEVGGGVQAALGRDLVGALGDERDGIGPRVARHRDHLLGGGHLDVEVRGDGAPERVEVVVLYVPPVAAQVDGDA